MQYLLLYQSMTAAQQAIRALGSRGIRSNMTRPPRGIENYSCSYAIIATSDNLNRASAILSQVGLAPVRMLVDYGGGSR